VVAHCGIRGETKAAVSGVRERRDRDPERYDRLFRSIGALAVLGREALLSGDAKVFGRIMDENHALLAEIGVSLPILDRMADSARAAGALGAKLSGAGTGGNVIALVEPASRDAVLDAFRSTGSTWEYSFPLSAS
jgi:mevalonate kinase